MRHWRDRVVGRRLPLPLLPLPLSGPCRAGQWSQSRLWDGGHEKGPGLESRHRMPDLHGWASRACRRWQPWCRRTERRPTKHSSRLCDEGQQQLRWAPILDIPTCLPIARQNQRAPEWDPGWDCSRTPPSPCYALPQQPSSDSADAIAECQRRAERLRPRLG
jgi:hypothetical protein